MLRNAALPESRVLGCYSMERRQSRATPVSSYISGCMILGLVFMRLARRPGMLDDLINKGKKLQWLSYLSLSAVVFIFLQNKYTC